VNVLVPLKAQERPAFATPHPAAAEPAATGDESPVGP
jgi:hypothetical protein